MADGEPIYEVRSVRLVLQGQASCFNRLVACERCGQDQAGAPVLIPADLDAPVRPVICKNCVRKAGVSSVWEPEISRQVIERAALPSLHAPAAVESREDSAPAAPGGRGAPMMPAEDEQLRRQLEVVTGGVDELIETLREQQLALAQARDDLASVTEASAARITSLEEELLQRSEELSQLVGAQRADINVIVTEIGQNRSEMERVADATEQLARAQQRIEQYALEAEGALSSTVAGKLAGVQAAFDERIEELADQVARATARFETLERRVEGLFDLMITKGSEGVTGASHGDATKLVAALDMQLQGASDRLAALSGATRIGRRDPGPERREEPEPRQAVVRATEGDAHDVARSRR